MAFDRVWVLVEGSGPAPAPTALELLTRARQLGAAEVEAVTWGAGTAWAPELGRFGATAVRDAGDLGPALVGVPVAAAMAAAMAAGAPDAVLFPQTNDGRDVAGRLSARLDRGVLTNVVGLAEDGTTEHAVFGGATLVTARFSGPGPHLYVVRPKSFAPEEAPAPVAPDVVPMPVPDTGAAGAAVVTARHAEARSGPRLDEADVVVAGGRGLGEASRFEWIEELASLLGGAPGASRAVVDAGWVPYALQIGQTGKTVKPNVYLACGISGATQHVVGMKGANHVVAVNRDRQAPIFSIADLGVVGDVAQVLPRLIEALRNRG